MASRPATPGRAPRGIRLRQAAALAAFAFLALPLGLGGPMPAAPQDRAARIALTQDGLRLEGSIVPGTLLGFALRLAAAVLVDLDGRTVVELDSSGGNLDAALKMSGVMRALQAFSRIDTRVVAGAACQSACTALFAAGHRREAARDALFMFHASRFAGRGADPTAAGRLQADLEARYLAALGRVDPLLLRRLEEEGAFDTPAPTYRRAEELGPGAAAFVTGFLPPGS
jgi:hypothetical protein